MLKDTVMSKTSMGQKWKKTSNKSYQTILNGCFVMCFKMVDKTWTLRANRGMSFWTSSVIEGKNN